ncbi:MAG: hypothetical protein HC915_07335 [Anaerolineae bacterium]|nr:hypothetical protein [Anaerolineae bacterium]
MPGNPVSALATFEVFVRPAILKMLGRPTAAPELAVMAGQAMESDGRESYIRVKLVKEPKGLVAYSTGTQSSGAISSLVLADALLVIPAGVEKIQRGDTLMVRPFGGQSIGI